MKSISVRRVALFCVFFTAAAPSHAQARTLSPEQITRIDAAAAEWLQETGAPSVSIAVVTDATLAYTHAYGLAQLMPPRPATVTARYAIDSISKEFVAAAVLILAEQRRLSLDDKVARWFPDLGEASNLTLRELLTHTSGLRDYWPQDFVTEEMTHPTTTAAILREWVRRPLDFAPGTDWQYSNTGFVLAGAIVEKASGEPLMRFLTEQIFAPLRMSRVTEDDTAPLGESDASPYTRYGLATIRPAPKEAAGWLFAAAGLAMQPGDLALWDISLIRRSLLQPDSYRTQFEPVVLKDGTRKDYALGLDVEQVNGRLRIGHGGAGSGYLSDHRIWPDDKVAIVVLTNSDWTSPSDLLEQIAYVVVPRSPVEARADTVFSGFQSGSVDRSLFTQGGNFFLTPQVLADLKASLAPLGSARLIELLRESRRGGMITRRWRILCGGHRLEAIERGYPDGKLEQFMVSAASD